MAIVQRLQTFSPVAGIKEQQGCYHTCNPSSSHVEVSVFICGKKKKLSFLEKDDLHLELTTSVELL